MDKKRLVYWTATILLIAALLATIVLAVIPKSINLQGQLKNSTGAVETGSKNITFRIVGSKDLISTLIIANNFINNSLLFNNSINEFDEIVSF